MRKYCGSWVKTRNFPLQANFFVHFGNEILNSL